MNRCNRCKGKLNKSYELFFGRKYHRACAVMTAYFYRQIRHRENLDALTIKQLNEYLDYRMELSPEEFRIRRQNELEIDDASRSDKGG